MQGIQQFSALTSSPLRSLKDSSLAGDPPVDLRSSQKFVRRVVEEPSIHGRELADGDNATTDLTDDTLAEGLVKEAALPTTMDISVQQSCEAQNDLEGFVPSNLSMGGTEFPDSARNQQMDTPPAMQAVGFQDPFHEKAAISDLSLRRVLSDTISGVLMEDAMVTQCGHSFGINGLQRVMEMKICLTCGAPVPSESLIPNYALRAAVLAYKREGIRRKKDFLAQPESSEGKKTSRALAELDVSRPKGVQFPYVANDRVLIKGNKRTPERFVGREAIITTQCLNGWYLVRTLDNGESVRLQYRSLQKMGDKETQTELEAGHGNGQSSDRFCNVDGLKGQSITSVPTSLSADGKEGSPSNLNDKMVATSFPSGIAKGMRSESLSRTIRGRRRGSLMRVADTTGASWTSGRTSGQTSSNSSQELQGEQVKKMLELHNLQVHDKNAQEAGTMDDSADEDMRATKRIAAIGTNGDVIEGLALQTGCSVRERKTMGSKGGVEAEGCTAELKASKKLEAVSAGENVVFRGSHGARSQGKVPRIRPKHNALQAQSTFSTRSDFQEADPYKKVYMSGCRRRGGNAGDGHASMSLNQSASASLNVDTDHCSASPLEEQHQEAEVKASGELNRLQNAAFSCEMIKKGMLDLETKIPWSCMRDDWKMCQADWLRMLQESHTTKDVGKRLQELRKALLLEKAGNMSDEEWTEKLEAALELESGDAVDHLWERLQEDISKWMECKSKRDTKPSSNIKDEFLDLKKLENLFPHLCVGGLSGVGVITATSIAAAEAFADGEQDMEALLAVPMKLIREHSKQDLSAVRDAIEREKRHISAKVMHLDSDGNNKGDSKYEDTDIGLLIENPKQVPVSPAFLAVEAAPFTTMFSNNPSFIRSEGGCIDYAKAPLMDDEGNEEVVPMEETDGEETDLSDSD